MSDPEESPSAPIKKRKKKRKADGAEVEVAPEDPQRERRIRSMLVAAGAVALVGIFLVGTGPSILGMVLVVAGVLGLVAGIHSFGRLGPSGG